MGNVAIALCFNDRYCQVAAATLASALAHISERHHYDFYILADAISAYNRRRLSALNHHDQAALHFIDCDLRRCTTCDLDHQRYPRQAFARLFLPQLLPALHRLLYLDSDLLINTDLATLFYSDLQDAALGAVRDPLYSVLPAEAPIPYFRTAGLPYATFGAYLTYHLGLPGSAQATYFNSGVLLIDMARYSAALAALPRLLGRKFFFADQDILNIIFHGRCRLLDPQWNVCSPQAIAAYLQAHDGRLPPILHYAGARPDRNVRRDFPARSAYWQTIAQTPFCFDALDEYLRTLIMMAVQRAAPPQAPLQTSNSLMDCSAAPCTLPDGGCGLQCMSSAQ